MPIWLTTSSLVQVAVGAIAAAAWFVYRGFEERNRIRRRIASDLHDEMGSRLSLIAIQSEIARRRLQGNHPEVVESLARIGAESRHALEAMGTVVWSLDPGHLRPIDLLQRMRRFAGDLLSPHDVALSFRAAAAVAEARLAPRVAQEIFLLFRESIHNTARHSGCTRVLVRVSVHQHKLVLLVHDDGRGFALEGASMGHGLRGMRDRAARMGGDVQIRTRSGLGTLLMVRVPVGTVAGALRSLLV